MTEGSGENAIVSPRIEPRSATAASTVPDHKQVTHRSSFMENVRGVPPSPRIHHRDSIASQHSHAVQDLIDHPPIAPHTDPAVAKFAHRDWRDVQVGEIVVPDHVRFVTADASVEDATRTLLTSSVNVVLLRQSDSSKTAIGAFDYDTLNAYLCLVTGVARPDEVDQQRIRSVADRAARHEAIPLADISYLMGRKEKPAFLEHTDPLPRAVEMFGSGIHRIIVTKSGSDEVLGVLTQLRLVRFFWEHVRSADALNARTLRDLALGESSVISINGDQPVRDALLTLQSKGISSLPVVDNHKNVIGNISHVDVKLLVSTASLPLLDSSCTHFINVILSERGVIDGKDSYPVFHVTPYTTLAHTVAKLVATRSHRMWVVDTASPASSVPPSPALKPTTAVPPLPPNAHGGSPTTGPPVSPATPSLAPAAANLPGASLSGRLMGVISLTDILNLYARACGLSPLDPEELRRKRRTSSSSSSMMRASLDSLRSGSLDLGGRKSLDGSKGSSADLRRRPSQSNR